jgi:hypothetical protein
MSLLKSVIKRIPPIRRIVEERNQMILERAWFAEELEKAKRTLERVRTDLHHALRYKTHFAPGHFHSPLPSSEQLRARSEAAFARKGAMLPGIDLNADRQLELLEVLLAHYGDFLFEDGTAGLTRFRFGNPNFSDADAFFYFSLIRHLRPRRIVEIGCGYSSCLALDVNEHYFQNSIACTFIDPFPQFLYPMLKPGDCEKASIIQDYVQEVPLGVFASLEAGDILFVDSSHISKADSDLNHILFYILPILDSGVYVHFYSIYYPFEYPQGAVLQGACFNEAYMLRAFLSQNRDYAIELFSSYLTVERRDLLVKRMPRFAENEGVSLWLRKQSGRSTPLSSVESIDRLRLTPAARRISAASTTRVDVVNPAHPKQLGAGWFAYDRELTRRWMGDHAEVVLSRPGRSGQRLWLNAHYHGKELAMLKVSANQCVLGTISLTAPGDFENSLPLPDSLVGTGEMRVTLQLDKTVKAPGDPRKLGLGFGRIYIE